MNFFTRNNPNYSSFSAEVSSGTAGHSTMYEPDFTKFELSAPAVAIKQEVMATDPDDEETHYESDEYYDEEGLKVQDTDYGMESEASMTEGQPPAENMDDCEGEGGGFPPKMWNVEEEPSSSYPRYTLEDMSPTVRDPQCSIVKSKLAYFWPVYVNNFWFVDRFNKTYFVKEYFASKGLHVRWWVHQKNGKLDKFQAKTGIYDLLVYFVSERDANLAIQRCHRDIYKGYTLNVFPGRVPVYFDPSRSLMVKKRRSGYIFSEQFYENHIKAGNPNVKISCTVKFDVGYGIMEFETRDDMLQAKRVKKFKSQAIKEQLQKQRFLEEDLVNEIKQLLAKQSTALRIDRGDKFTNMLLNGQRPKINSWKKRNAQPMNAIQQRVADRYRLQIVRAMNEGRKIHCWSTNEGNKRCFSAIYRQLKKDRAEGMPIS